MHTETVKFQVFGVSDWTGRHPNRTWVQVHAVVRVRHRVAILVGRLLREHDGEPARGVVGVEHEVQVYTLGAVVSCILSIDQKRRSDNDVVLAQQVAQVFLDHPCHLLPPAHNLRKLQLQGHAHV